MPTKRYEYTKEEGVVYTTLLIARYRDLNPEFLERIQKKNNRLYKKMRDYKVVVPDGGYFLKVEEINTYGKLAKFLFLTVGEGTWNVYARSKFKKNKYYDITFQCYAIYSQRGCPFYSSLCKINYKRKLIFGVSCKCNPRFICSWSPLCRIEIFNPGEKYTNSKLMERHGILDYEPRYMVKHECNRIYKMPWFRDRERGTIRYGKQILFSQTKGIIR